MEYKYNIQTNEYPEIYMPGYGEPKEPNMPIYPPTNQSQSTVPQQTQQSSNNQVQPNTNIPTLPSDATNDNNAYILFLYPKEAREISKIVNNKLNTLDYEGSIIFHEYPDKEALKNIIDQINVPFSVEEISPNWLRQLIEVIFINEMNNKRKEHNNNNNNNNTLSNSNTM